MIFFISCLVCTQRQLDLLIDEIDFSQIGRIQYRWVVSVAGTINLPIPCKHELLYADTSYKLKLTKTYTNM